MQVGVHRLRCCTYSLLEPYAYLSPSIPTGDGDGIRLDECVKSSLQRKLAGEFLQEGIPGDVHTSFPRPSPAGDTSQAGMVGDRGWPGRDMHTAPVWISYLINNFHIFRHRQRTLFTSFWVSFSALDRSCVVVL
ncbi:hypothetical protein Y032_0198g1613 [Ancylostoma ceylanicum]|uniref:Uncharacterized protein n=1 Tax=Ancylostoma ceylanicum TaxID=53326 RepID=A0A016SNA9_9BILA|nr:hypothetical protein Y032_0198g1613 [Ancylostoma ceylanicum]